ncbi:hypothetical protein [Vreelandella sp. V005]|uniref:hypothetical protein n=1 Tax=Vreelandella sp. V005 TaxID=3459608 RepID=UPI004043E7D6
MAAATLALSRHAVAYGAGGFIYPRGQCKVAPTSDNSAVAGSFEIDPLVVMAGLRYRF